MNHVPGAKEDRFTSGNYHIATRDGYKMVWKLVWIVVWGWLKRNSEGLKDKLWLLYNECECEFEMIYRVKFMMMVFRIDFMEDWVILVILSIVCEGIKFKKKLSYTNIQFWFESLQLTIRFVIKHANITQTISKQCQPKISPQTIEVTNQITIRFKHTIY